jgi:hypothetical protein
MMKKITVGNIKFTKPVVEKLVDIHYVVSEKGRDILKHRYFILSYEEFDKSLDEIISQLDGKDIKLLVVDETVMVDFGDENIEKHLDTKIFYDEEWIKKHNPSGDFNLWLVEFVDRLILANKGKC